MSTTCSHSTKNKESWLPLLHLLLVALMEISLLHLRLWELLPVHLQLLHQSKHADQGFYGHIGFRSTTSTKRLQWLYLLLVPQVPVTKSSWVLLQQRPPLTLIFLILKKFLPHNKHEDIGLYVHIAFQYATTTTTSTISIQSTTEVR